MVQGDSYLSAKLRVEASSESKGGRGQADDGDDDLGCADFSQFDAEARGLIVWSPQVGDGDGDDEGDDDYAHSLLFGGLMDAATCCRPV